MIKQLNVEVACGRTMMHSTICTLTGPVVVGIDPAESGGFPIIRRVTSGILFGANKIPEFIKALTSGMKEFKNAASNIQDSSTQSDNDLDNKNDE